MGNAVFYPKSNFFVDFHGMRYQVDGGGHLQTPLGHSTHCWCCCSHLKNNVVVPYGFSSKLPIRVVCQLFKN